MNETINREDEMNKIILTNEFHGTEAVVHGEIKGPQDWSDGRNVLILTESQAARAQKKLCCEECGCSGTSGTRGRQIHDGERFLVSVAQDRFDG